MISSNILILLCVVVFCHTLEHTKSNHIPKDGKVSTRDQSKSGSLYKQVTLACPNFICFEDNMCVDLCELDVRPQLPPQKIVITNESGAQLESVVGPFPEGASFTLRCDVFGVAELREAQGAEALPPPPPPSPPGPIIPKLSIQITPETNERTKQRC
ncbi:hypothetical protein Zmor_020354 [Zophobas morio]|uniref:Uncharacterized protein n=1 Tax=Zophobas morio TaxID=2755281 RepID=A0AA38I424_9CUCU|nr:hypothetical protein Zmor_020354 [Zophobas morio]